MKLATVIGARPQFVKAAPVSVALREAGIEEVLLHTGQHYDYLMSEVFFEELGLAKPQYNLDIHGLPHGAMTGRMLERIEAVFERETPDAVLVYGDTNSTLAGALAAAKLHIPIAHVEAGLRSYRRTMPEEINRVLVDHLSTLLFCPTRAAVDNLAREGVTAGVHHVGDVMYDTTLAATSIARSRSDILGKLGVADKSYAVATVHRAENTDDPARLGAVVAWLEAAAAALPVILPVHPRTRAKLAGLGRPLRNVVLVEPLGYLDMTELVSHSAAVYTDSGGLQKEAYFHRVPCVTLRDETEWVETIAAGWNRLWTVESYEPRHDIADYGDGHTSRAIAQLIRKTWATGRSSA